MTIDATGLSTYWGHQFRPLNMEKLIKQQCIDWKQPVSELTRLSLKGLSGGFLVLVVGYVLAILTFVLEFLARRY